RGKLAAEALGRLDGEDRALRAPDEERRAADAPYRVPEALQVRRHAPPDARIELVDPASTLVLPQRVTEPILDVRARAARVEGERLLDGLLEGPEVAHRELRADGARPGGRDGRRDVDHHQATDAVGVGRRERDRVDAAHAEPDERGRRPAALVEKRTHVLD